MTGRYYGFFEEYMHGRRGDRDGADRLVTAGTAKRLRWTRCAREGPSGRALVKAPRVPSVPGRGAGESCSVEGQGGRRSWTRPRAFPRLRRPAVRGDPLGACYDLDRRPEARRSRLRPGRPGFRDQVADLPRRVRTSCDRHCLLRRPVSEVYTATWAREERTDTVPYNLKEVLSKPGAVRRRATGSAPAAAAGVTVRAVMRALEPGDRRPS
jgi:hypothetical protein